jgi:hypothetical protein
MTGNLGTRPGGAPVHEARARGEDIARTKEFEWFARAGLAARGVVYIVIGVLAIKLALGDGGKATSREGALQSLAQQSFGKVVLILLALGFGAYALWRFVQAFAERKWGAGAGYVGRGLIYAALTFSAIKILVGAQTSGSQTQRAHKTAATVLGWPAGTWIVGIAGAVTIGVGLWNLYRGLSRNFEKKWRGGMGQSARKWGGRAGVLGHIARAAVFALIGIFAVKAALDYNPKDAIGLDGALQKLAHASYGPYVLGLTAAGLICYGLYCLVDARYRDVSTNGAT